MPLNMPRFFSLAATAHPRDHELRRAYWSFSRVSRMALQPSLLHVSVVALLVFFSFLLSHGETAAVQGVCHTHDPSNPLAASFPNNSTGVLNATLAIIPIPLETARRLIPSQYRILEHAYRAVIPDFPKGMYPVLLQTAHDHDVQFRAYNITIDDFSVSFSTHCT